MLRVLVILFIALAMVAIAIGKVNMMVGLVVVGLLVLFAGILYRLGRLHKDVRGSEAPPREATGGSREQGPQR